MSDPELDNFLAGLTNDERYAILETARVALQDAETAFHIGWDMSMSDADLNNLQHKIHQFLEGDDAKANH